MSVLRVGTRGSHLALTQTDWVIARLRAAHPALTIERVIIESEGDRRREASLLSIGGQGVFTKALEEALLDSTTDVAVHSLKDLPSSLPEGLRLAATPAREDVRDLLLTRDGLSLAQLPEGAVVGTGSLRRRAQLLARRPDLTMKDIRGNVDTRLAKLERGEYDAIVLAAAGLSRLGWLARVPSQPLDVDLMLPAPAQGILGLECRADDEVARRLLAAINEATTFAVATAERAVLRRFGAGCRLPLAALATVAGDELTVRARVLAADGGVTFNGLAAGPLEMAEQLGTQAAEQLVQQGGMALLEDVHDSDG